MRNQTLESATHAFYRHTDEYHDMSDTRRSTNQSLDQVMDPTLGKSALNLTCMLATSLSLQPFITVGIIAQTKKVKAMDDDVSRSYTNIYKRDVSSLSVGEFYKDSAKILQRRTVSSLFPTAISSYIADKSGLGAIGMTMLSTSFETILATVIPESAEKFKSANRKDFPLVDKNNNPVDIQNPLSKEKFFRLCANSKNTLHFGEKEYNDLVNKQKNYKANLHAQVRFLAARNGIFSSAIFLAKELAKTFVDINKDKIQESGIDLDTATNVLTYAIRAKLAFLTTPLERAFTQLSIGDKPAKEILSSFVKDFSRGNPNLFVGAAARTILCVMTASTIAEGLWVSNQIEKHARKLGTKHSNEHSTGEDLLIFCNNLLNLQGRQQQTKQNDEQEPDPLDPPAIQDSFRRVISLYDEDKENTKNDVSR